MREHGVLDRVLLVYEEALWRVRNKKEVRPEVFHTPAELVRRFVEDLERCSSCRGLGERTRVRFRMTPRSTAPAAKPRDSCVVTNSRG